MLASVTDSVCELRRELLIITMCITALKYIIHY